jgi:hypothetical protein
LDRVSSHDGDDMMRVAPGGVEAVERVQMCTVYLSLRKAHLGGGTSGNLLDMQSVFRDTANHAANNRMGLDLSAST